MRAIGRLVVLFVAAGLAVASRSTPGSASEATPPQSPRPRPVEGALFSDDFRTGRLDRWRPDRPGVWRVQSGMLRAELPNAKQQHSLIFAGDSTWSDYTLEFDVCGMRGVDKGAVVRTQGNRGLGLDLRGPGYQDVKIHLNELPLGRASIQNGNAVWHHVRFEVRGDRCRVAVNGEALFNRKLPQRIPKTGGIGLAAYTGGVGECVVFYDNVVVTGIPEKIGAAR